MRSRPMRRRVGGGHELRGDLSRGSESSVVGDSQILTNCSASGFRWKSFVAFGPLLPVGIGLDQARIDRESFSNDRSLLNTATQHALEVNRLGYVEGQNLGVNRYSGEGRARYAELARDVVNTHPDLIVISGGRLSLDFKMATTAIPIVTLIIDPIAMGLTASIARPGGNITGVAIAGGLEIIGKRLGLLVEAMPKPSTVGYLASQPFWEDQRGAITRPRPGGDLGLRRTGLGLLRSTLGDRTPFDGPGGETEMHCLSPMSAGVRITTENSHARSAGTRQKTSQLRVFEHSIGQQPF